MTKPCATCPWRKGSNDQDIPGFNLDEARALRKTCEQGFGGVFACHCTKEGADKACAGWLQSVSAHNNFTVRMALINGDLPRLNPDDDCFDTFEAMVSHHGWEDKDRQGAG